jgi:hypothetical protein
MSCKISSISRADSLEEIAEFWDTHDFTDFDSDAPDVEFEITCAVPVEIDLLSSVEKQARQRGVSVETLVNLWLQQKLVEHSQRIEPAYAVQEAPEEYTADQSGRDA